MELVSQQVYSKSMYIEGHLWLYNPYVLYCGETFYVNVCPLKFLDVADKIQLFLEKSVSRESHYQWEKLWINIQNLALI